MITIVDYGLGNVQAFLNVFKRLNVEARSARNPGDLRNASKLILPGVGDFDHAMERLEQSGMRQTLDDMVLRERVPVLGVCVGMQMLAQGSEEGSSPGLGWIEGHVEGVGSLDAARSLPVPHMGWNDVCPTTKDRLFDQLESAARFYFLHAYYFRCAHPEDVAAVSSYGGNFSSAVHSKNIYGVQFHPEKSHHFGTRLLLNFATL